MQAYCLDLPQRVVSAYENGVETILEVAERFEVSDSFVKKLLRRKRSTGTIARVGHRGGQPKRLSGTHRKWLLKTVLAAPDIMLEDLRERLLSQHNVSASVATLCRELKALNLRRKKSRWSLRAAQQAQAGVALAENETSAARAAQISGRGGSDDNSDPEQWAAREPPKRCRITRGQSTSMISTIGVAGVEATMLIEGSVDTLVFNAYCREVLRPTLKNGDVIVLDNLAAHRASRIEEITAECGARVIWLPYSPDFSPIELMWSKVKAYLRKVRARTQTELEKAIAAALKTIRASDCVNNTPSETSRAATHWSAASLVFIGFIK